MVSLSFLIFGVLVFTSSRKTTKYELSISAGSPNGLRARFIELLGDNFDDQKRSDSVTGAVELSFLSVPTSGSIDSLEKVNAGQLDLAFVQGGLPTKRYPEVRQVASMHLEALHLLVKPSLVEQCREHLFALRGRSIATSPKGSGTHLLSIQVLRFVGIGDDDYVERNDRYVDLMEIAERSDDGSELPDAVFIVSSLPSPVAATLISKHGYRLISLPIAEPLRRAWLTDQIGTIIEKEVALGLRRVQQCEIPQMIYQIDPPRPDRSIETVGTRLNLVAGPNVPEKVITALSKSVYETEIARVTDQRIHWEDLNEFSEFPLHKGTQKYLAAKQPIATGRVIEVTEQLVGIVGALLGTLLFIWQWLRRMRSRRRDGEFVVYIDRVIKIENEALSYEDDAEVPIERMQEMQEELSRLKSDLITRFRDGYLEGTEMLSSFLKHANDTSELISRIILHRMK